MGPAAVLGLLAIVVPLSSTLSGCVTYQFVHYLSRIKRAQYIAGLIASLTFSVNLIGLAFQIIIFRSFTQKALFDDGPIRIPSWQLISLLTVNFLTATISRVYFTRLASTMLRSPRIFLCASLFLFGATTAGRIPGLIYAGNVALVEDSPLKRSLLHTFSLSAAALWDCLICGVLLSNFLNPQKRCRFGSLEGKASFGITLIFESFFAATFLMISVFVALSVISAYPRITRNRLNVIYSNLGCLSTKLYGISTLYSLQHKMNEHAKLTISQKSISKPETISNNISGATQCRSHVFRSHSGLPEVERGEENRPNHSLHNPSQDTDESDEATRDGFTKAVVYQEHLAPVGDAFPVEITCSVHESVEDVTQSTEKTICEISEVGPFELCKTSESESD